MVFRHEPHLLLLVALVLVLPSTSRAADDCPNDCGPNGQCLEQTRGCEPGVSCTTECECDVGWGGADCDLQMMRCPEALTDSPDNAMFCFNGGTCEEVEVDATVDPDGVGMVCDCETAAVADLAYAGHQCEYRAQVSCEEGREFSNYAFCVNEGTCKTMVPPNDPHPLCDCPDEFEGRHCQFKAGTAPAQERIYRPKGGFNEGGWTSMAVFLLVVLILAALAFVGVCLLRRRRARLADANSHTKPSIRAVTSDLDLDTNDHAEDPGREII